MQKVSFFLLALLGAFFACSTLSAQFLSEEYDYYTPFESHSWNDITGGLRAGTCIIVPYISPYIAYSREISDRFVFHCDIGLDQAALGCGIVTGSRRESCISLMCGAAMLHSHIVNALARLKPAKRSASMFLLEVRVSFKLSNELICDLSLGGVVPHISIGLRCSF